LLNRDVLTYMLLRHPPRDISIVQAMFNAQRLEKINPYLQCPDIIVDWCC
jgi:hypothetical protein